LKITAESHRKLKSEMNAQKTLVPSGLNRVGSGRASGRNQRSFSLTNSSNYDGKIAGLYDLEETLGELSD
jgi:hypothetical protein